VLQTSSNSLKYKYGYSRFKPWKVGKSWILPILKFKWDTLEGKTIHDGALVLIGFMWSLNVLRQLLSLWSDWLSSATMFSKEDEDFLESLPLNMCDQTLIQMQKEKRKGRKNKIR